MFYREYWHPKTTAPAVLTDIAKRISQTIRVYAYTLDPDVRMAASGDLGRLRQFGISYEQTGKLTDATAIFEYLDGAFAKLAKAGWVEVEESLSYRAFLHGGADAGKFWNVRLAGGALEIFFGKTAVKRRPLHANAGTRTVKAFATRDEALAAYHKMVGEKLKKGYVELFPRATAFSTPLAPKTATKRK